MSEDPKYTHLLRTRAYLRSLPDGLASYPECRGKGSVWKNILTHTDTRGLAERVPPEVAMVPESSVLGGAWIALTQSFAGHLVLRDCVFPTDEAICAHFRELDRKLLGGPLYRVMFAVASPQMAVRASTRHFAALFRGIVLSAHQEESTRVHLTLTFPPMLLPPLVGRLYLVAFEVAVELAGGKGVRGRVLEHGRTAAHYELAWG